MRTSFPFTGARTLSGVLVALALATPAVAQGAASAISPDGDACAPMMARWQSAEAEYSALKPADLSAYNVIQNEIDQAAHRCEAGQDADAAKIMAGSKRPPPDLGDFSAKASP